VVPSADRDSGFTKAIVAGMLAVLCWLGVFSGVAFVESGRNLPEGMVTMVGMFVIFMSSPPAPVCTVIAAVGLHEQGWRRTAWLIALAGLAGFLALALYVVSIFSS